MERKIYNPIQKDQVIFLKTHADTNGEFTLVEVELADGGGVGLHYHKTYAEKFECLEGEVQVRLGKKKFIHSNPVNPPRQRPLLTTCFATGVVSPVNSW